MRGRNPQTVGACIKPIIANYPPEQWSELLERALSLYDSHTLPDGPGGSNQAPRPQAMTKPKNAPNAGRRVQAYLTQMNKDSEKKCYCVFEDYDNRTTTKGSAWDKHALEMMKMEIGSLVEFVVRRKPKADGAGMWTNIEDPVLLQRPAEVETKPRPEPSWDNVPF